MTRTLVRCYSLAFAAMLILGPAAAAGQEGHEGHNGHETSPYAGAGSEQVQTLTAEEVDQLLEGAGMGLARPAELNGYPGPRHVLDLADSLALTEDQRAGVMEVFERMERAAVDLGRQIIDAERVLDRAFAEGAAPARIEALVHDVARLRGGLRWIHLRAHLEMFAILTMHQRHEYDRLRGYGADHGH